MPIYDMNGQRVRQPDDRPSEILIRSLQNQIQHVAMASAALLQGYHELDDKLALALGRIERIEKQVFSEGAAEEKCPRVKESAGEGS